LLPEKEIVTGDARKRIAAIRRYTHLGAGFKLALRDLEIRGAGNLLGAEQSGQINNIGFDLYCQLLRSTVSRLKGQSDDVVREVDVNIDFISFSEKPAGNKIGACFPLSFIESERLRLNAYRRLSLLSAVEDVEVFTEELQDRYGEIPDAVSHLLQYAVVKLLVSKSGAYKLNVNDSKIVFEGAWGIYRENGRFPVLEKKTFPAQLRELILFLKRRVQKSKNKTNKT